MQKPAPRQHLLHGFSHMQKMNLLSTFRKAMKRTVTCETKSTKMNKQPG
uniref:Uncharacterized protein n=1 Tax=Rhizophora mucronata TaxID=61149 RepID=A0A2P2PD48_RHIMU